VKMQAYDFRVLCAAIQPLDTEERRAKYRRRDFPLADRVQDVYKRYRWDLLWLSKVDISRMYDYLDDSNIDTALKRIVPSLLE